MGIHLDSDFDPQLFELIPHRPPMLLIHKLLHVDERSSSSLVNIAENISFYENGLGVPAWVGLEYMGQTAALIAGYQLKQGIVSPHIGFLLGTRSFKSESAYFTGGARLKVSCTEKALVGDDLATFDCLIENYDNPQQHNEPLAAATLSVLRRPKS
ncbi:3-hydroxydecanoyl-ACP dehydratase [Glaciecola siphonariae]|uniref:3-hydroxydecanoyl-ACP dehydratase n=1 Tax=Glaciecola siphonariae TaxID=521012 RepID=A0ABV9LYX5_9ALTE